MEAAEGAWLNQPFYCLYCKTRTANNQTLLIPINYLTPRLCDPPAGADLAVTMCPGVDESSRGASRAALRVTPSPVERVHWHASYTDS